MSTPQQPNFQPNQYGPIPPQGPPVPPTGPQPMQQPPAKPKRFGWLALSVAALVALLLGVGIGGAGNKSTTVGAAAPTPAPTVTVTTTAPAVDTSSDEPTDEPTDDTSSTTYEPHKSDFKLGIKTLSKKCFGSAGCNVTFRINPEYVGDQALPTSGEIEVSYKVTGLEDAVENTFTIDDEGTAHYEKEEYGSTESKSDDLKVKVTDVSYSE